MANLKIPDHHQRWWLHRDFVPAGTGLLDTPSGLTPGGPAARPFIPHQMWGLPGNGVKKRPAFFYVVSLTLPPLPEKRLNFRHFA
jgi:hypothetical protein